MAIEYADRSFSETLPLVDAMKKLIDEVNAGVKIRALHIGTPLEIEQRKKDAGIENRLAMLESKIRELEPSKSYILHIPTPDELREFNT